MSSVGRFALAQILPPPGAPQTELGLPVSRAFLYQDCPTNPENFVLRQPLVGSNGPMSVYAGNVFLDAGGEAIVVLPDYFQRLHPKSSSWVYQLSALDKPLTLFVKDRISENRFRIRAVEGLSAQGAQVSWTVLAPRADTVNRASTLPAVALKPNPGAYWNPETYAYLDVFDIPADNRRALWRLTQQMLQSVPEIPRPLVDVCIVGSFSQGVARPMHSADPSDFDLAFVLARPISEADHNRFRNTLLPLYADSVRQLANIRNPVDIMFIGQEEILNGDPNLVFFSLREDSAYGRPNNRERLNVKLVEYGGKFYRFNRSGYTVLYHTGIIGDTELRPSGPGRVAYFNRATGELLLESEVPVR